MAQTELKSKLAEVLGNAGELQLEPQSGGDTHQSFKLTSVENSQYFFLKINSPNRKDVLQSEGESLRLIGELLDGVYPTYITEGNTKELTLLLMSYHSLETLSSTNASSLGTVLAAQHRVEAKRFGWAVDNFIGSTKQLNGWTDSWTDFFINNRLRQQLLLAQDKGLPVGIAQSINFILDSPPQEFLMHTPRSALVHGDLWAGNAGYDSIESRAILYDPAPYFGDPEVDLAMSELFGKFPSQFYKAYYKTHARAPGYEVRKTLYNLYHALNHFNMFGVTYLSLVENHTQDLS